MSKWALIFDLYRFLKFESHYSRPATYQKVLDEAERYIIIEQFEDGAGI